MFWPSAILLQTINKFSRAEREFWAALLAVCPDTHTHTPADGTNERCGRAADNFSQRRREVYE